MLSENLLDVFFISETKLDISFPNPQFLVPGFCRAYCPHSVRSMDYIIPGYEIVGFACV